MSPEERTAADGGPHQLPPCRTGPPPASACTDQEQRCQDSPARPLRGAPGPRRSSPAAPSSSAGSGTRSRRGRTPSGCSAGTGPEGRGSGPPPSRWSKRHRGARLRVDAGRGEPRPGDDLRPRRHRALAGDATYAGVRLRTVAGSIAGDVRMAAAETATGGDDLRPRRAALASPAGPRRDDGRRRPVRCDGLHHRHRHRRRALASTEPPRARRSRRTPVRSRRTASRCRSRPRRRCPRGRARRTAGTDRGAGMVFAATSR